MKFLLPIILIFALIGGGCRSKQKPPAAGDTIVISNPWIKLIDSNGIKGWHSYGKKEAGSAWKVDSNVLHLNASEKDGWQTKNGGDLVTNDEYDEFELHLDWKISRSGNSGILFYVKEDPKLYAYSWYTGIETQIADNDKNEDGQIPTHHAGDLYDLMSISKDVVKPAGEWNKTMIIVAKNRLNIFINDEQVLSTMIGDDNWKKMVKDSKFKAYPDFARFKKGHIVLQDHGADVWFRNIQIKKL